MKKISELYELAKKEKSSYRNDYRVDHNNDCIRELTDSIMSLSKAENNEEELEALADIQWLLHTIKFKLSTYEEQLAEAKARNSVYTNYINEMNNKLSDI